MRTKIVVLILFAAGGAALWLWLGGGADRDGGPPPEVLNVGPAEVTIAWQGDRAGEGVVWYQPATARQEARRASDDLGIASRHEVVIEGLEPGTRYFYWLGRVETARRYEFVTAPPVDMPCWFVLTWGDVSGVISSLTVSEPGEFAVSLTPIDLDRVDPLAAARAYMPVYDPAGVSSPYLRGAAGASAPVRDGSPWSLDWGPLRLVVLGAAPEDPGDLLEAGAAQTVAVICHGPETDGWVVDGKLAVEAVRASSVHKAVTSRNGRGKPRAAFVIAPAGARAEGLIDSVRYVAIDVRSGPGAARIDVAPESSQLVFLTGEPGEPISLRRPPLKQKLTCAECRRLANRGAYEASIKAYEQFIADNRGHYQIDDAYYAIAEILDERLFRFARAVTWYRRLGEKYPDSTLAPMARRRIEYLDAHGDFDYKPLVRFERVRRVDFARSGPNTPARAKCLAEVADILETYPNCSLAPAMTYWLANRHRLADPDRAAGLYRTLIEKFPASRQAGRAWLEMGQTYYDAGLYDKARAVFEEALAADAGGEKEIRTQLARVARNLHRRHLAVAAWAALGVIGLAAMFVPPLGVRFRRVGLTAGAFALLGAGLLCGGWLIREQFASNGEMMILCLVTAGIATLNTPLSAALGLKLCRATSPQAATTRRALASVCGCLFSLVLLAAGMYLLLYTVNEHYLIIAGL